MRRRLVSTLVAAGLVLGGAGIASATADARPNRFAGDDRFDTARAVAEGTFESSNLAVMASGRSFPDALAAAYLSGQVSAPILLTEPTTLPAGVTDTLEALGVNGVQLIGGSAAISGNVAVQLENAGYVVDRLAGQNRYETAAAVAGFLPPEAVGEFGAGPAAIVVSGLSFADALAAGPASAHQGMPILLTGPNTLHPAARAALDELGIEQALIVGGTAAVSVAVAGEINAMGINVRRLAGTTRQLTSVRVARMADAELQFPLDRVLLARGDDFADALAGGARGGRFQAPILLTQSVTELGTAARNYIREHTDTIELVEILGGVNAVSKSVEDDAVRAARG